MRIAGIDEAGRGALFGPVVAAAVILNPKRRIVGLDDSKKLTSERRAELAPRIRDHALAWAVAEVDAQRIDAWNIYQASRQAMTAALQGLTISPDYLLIDAMQLDVLIEQKSLIKGDARSISIAAASILAKTHRDTRMEEWDAIYPQYGLARHKGYGTPDHLEALRRHGPSPLPPTFLRSGARMLLLGCWRDANFTANVLTGEDKMAVEHSLSRRNAIGNQPGRNIVRVFSVSIAIALVSVVAVLVVAKPAIPDSATLLAATPPIGWNSWDAYGETVSEADIRANAQWMAEHLKSSGWQYVVVDSGWYVTNHSAGTNADSAQFSLDAYGRYTPAVNTIPSAAQSRSFKPLADYIHSLGLKFGIHILRGIPKEAVRRKLADRRNFLSRRGCREYV